jgi:hypothetical protein
MSAATTQATIEVDDSLGNTSKLALSGAMRVAAVTNPPSNTFATAVNAENDVGMVTTATADPQSGVTSFASNMSNRRGQYYAIGQITDAQSVPQASAAVACVIPFSATGLAQVAMCHLEFVIVAKCIVASQVGPGGAQLADYRIQAGFSDWNNLNGNIVAANLSNNGSGNQIITNPVYTLTDDRGKSTTGFGDGAEYNIRFVTNITATNPSTLTVAFVPAGGFTAPLRVGTTLVSIFVTAYFT